MGGGSPKEIGQAGSLLDFIGHKTRNLVFLSVLFLRCAVLQEHRFWVASVARLSCFVLPCALWCSPSSCARPPCVCVCCGVCVGLWRPQGLLRERERESELHVCYGYTRLFLLSFLCFALVNMGVTPRTKCCGTVVCGRGRGRGYGHGHGHGVGYRCMQMQMQMICYM